MNSCELVTLVSTITCILSDCIEDDNQLALLSAVFTQLGDSLNTVLTCRENNIGSKKTMEKFIGESDTLVPSMYEGIMEYRYWIDVNKNLNNENALKLK